MLKKRWIQKQKIRAVHDNEVKELLSTMGLSYGVEHGEYRCIHCGEIINIRNLGALYPEGETINLVCDRLSCLGKVNLYGEGENE